MRYTTSVIHVWRFSISDSLFQIWIVQRRQESVAGKRRVRTVIIDRRPGYALSGLLGQLGNRFILPSPSATDLGSELFLLAFCPIAAFQFIETFSVSAPCRIEAVLHYQTTSFVGGAALSRIDHRPVLKCCKEFC